MKKILWIAPNLNHYKVKCINRLVESGALEISVLAGKTVPEMGHRRHKGRYLVSKVEVEATKNEFGVNLSVYGTLYGLIRHGNFEFVLMPLEKKHFLVILFIFILKKFVGFRLISYSHPVTKGSAFGLGTEKLLNKVLFMFYDGVIFYTREGRDWAVNSRLIPARKASFANNTLDTKGIWSSYNFEINKSNPKTILFIGRLVTNKRVDLLIEYHRELKKDLPGMRLIIIGDGPEADKVKLASEKADSISWEGAIVNEAEIARHMRTAHLVFVPGWSGLSIVHAFAYGKPYVTIAGPHPPEIGYLKDGENGLILSGNITSDCDRIARFLNDSQRYELACRAAFNKAKELSVENWCVQMISAMCE